jgi:hypothetical protein
VSAPQSAVPSVVPSAARRSIEVTGAWAQRLLAVFEHGSVDGSIAILAGRIREYAGADAGAWLPLRVYWVDADGRLTETLHNITVELAGYGPLADDGDAEVNIYISLPTDRGCYATAKFLK